MKLRSGKVINTRSPYKKRVYRKKPKVSQVVKSYVKRQIHSNTENKVFVTYGVNNAITTAGAGATPTNLILLPQLSQGSAQGQRIGQEIKIKSGYVRGFVNLLPYNGLTNPLSTPIYIKMWLVSSKLLNSASLASSSISNDFFETGSSNVGFQGNMLDCCLTNNKDAYTIYATKTMELGATSVTSNGQVGTGGYFDNSRMSRPFYFSFGKHFKSMLKYNDGTNANSNYPYNRNLWLIFQAVNADGSSTATQIAEFHYNIRVEYEDA